MKAAIHRRDAEDAEEAHLSVPPAVAGGWLRYQDPPATAGGTDQLSALSASLR
ncbi:MAG TPA: hypothetical protein VGC66_25495 [Pyrinomonadaceae bacterium]